MGRVEGKVALVTGAGGGLGKADSELLAKEGAKIVVTDINEANATKVANAIGANAIAAKHDVTSEDDWKHVLALAEKTFGGLNILVNNAGIVQPASPEDTTLESFRLHYAVNTESVFIGCQLSIPVMAKSGGGSIVNISSTAALMGFPPYFAYSASKGAVRSMTKSIAIHCQQQRNGIRCNSVHPGGIETPMTQAVMGRPGIEEQVPTGILPPGQMGAPSDVANLVLYLASDESRYVTAGEFVVDNGTLYAPDTRSPGGADQQD